MKLRKLLWLGGFVASFSVISYIQVTSYAFDGPTVNSARKHFKGCREANRFDAVDENLYIKGSNFPKNTDVDVYVTENRGWLFGDIIGSYIIVTTETVTTNSRGNIRCAKIWENPLSPGKYDIVVDANQDGTFNQGDAADGISDKPGFKVVD